MREKVIVMMIKMISGMSGLLIDIEVKVNKEALTLSQLFTS